MTNLPPMPEYPTERSAGHSRSRGSLRTRLQIWHGLILTSFLAVFAVFGRETYSLAWKSRLQQLDHELDRPAEVIVSRTRRLFPFPWAPGFRPQPGQPGRWHPGPGPLPNEPAPRPEFGAGRAEAGVRFDQRPDAATARVELDKRQGSEPTRSGRPTNDLASSEPISALAIANGIPAPRPVRRTGSGRDSGSRDGGATNREPSGSDVSVTSPREPFAPGRPAHPEPMGPRAAGDHEGPLDRDNVPREPRDLRDPFVRGVRPPEFPEPSLGLPEDFQHLFEGPEEMRLYFVVWDRDGKVLQKSDSASDVPFPNLKVGEDRLPVRSVRTRGNYREVVHTNSYDINVLVGRSIAKDIAEHHHSGRLLILAGVAILVGGLIGGWWTTSRAIRPFAEMTAVAESISARRLSQRIVLQETDSELGHLASVLNGTFDRLQAAFEQQTRFTADASHELRTPVAVILANSDLALSRPRSDEEYKAALATCRNSARRMKLLIEGLLALARFDADAAELKTSEFDLASVVRDAVDLLTSLAAERGIVIESNLAETLITGDKERLSQVVVNLLTNAIRYNREAGRVLITVEPKGDGVVMSVTDTGIGIANDDLPHVFERFFRADKARARVEGSCGLGLSICKTIVDAHGGTISARSEIDRGSTFEVRLPVRQKEVPGTRPSPV